MNVRLVDPTTQQVNLARFYVVHTAARNGTLGFFPVEADSKCLAREYVEGLLEEWERVYAVETWPEFHATAQYRMLRVGGNG